jgi:hypothetical protein
VKEISTMKIRNPQTGDEAIPPARAVPASVADNGRVRMGFFTPAFPATK